MILNISNNDSAINIKFDLIVIIHIQNLTSITLPIS